MLRLWTLITLAGLTLANASTTTNTSTAGANSTSNKASGPPVVTVTNGTDFCLFLPPQPGLDVATHETDGVPFCTSARRGIPALPEGFITTAHYADTANYVQVTGWIDHTKYGLQDNDGGGQYDSHDKGKPRGASCHGYPYFVSMIEPNNNRFCIRCCKSVTDCNPGRSQYGCLRVVPGDYSTQNTGTTQPGGSTQSAPVSGSPASGSLASGSLASGSPASST